MAVSITFQFIRIGADTFGIEYSYNISEQQDDNPKSWKKIGEGIDICNMSWDDIFSSLVLEFIKNDTYYFSNLIS